MAFSVWHILIILALPVMAAIVVAIVLISERKRRK